MNKPGGFLLAGAVALSLFLLPASRAFAQPTNDYCTNAVTLTLDVPFVMNTVDATSDGDPTNICGAPFGKGVWFEVIPPRNGKLTLSTCESDFDTVLEVYTGSCDSFTQVVCADDTGPVCNNDKASVSFLVGAGAHYFIVVGGSGGASGNLSIEATMDPPPNDQCSGAIPLTAGTPFSMSTASATETNDPVPPCQPGFGRGVWFQFTATNTGPLTFSTYESDLYTALEVFTGSCGALIPLTCDSSDGPGPGGARGTVHFQGTNGTTYLILVGGYYGGIKSGNIQILAEEGLLENDLCSGAIPMVAGTTYTMRTTSATSSGDPQPACNFPTYGFGNGVWYNFTPVTNGVATISTCGSDFDTSMQVYTGSCGALTAITDGCSYHTRSDCETNRASATFEAEAGVSYHILVGGINSEAGHLVIQAALSAPLANDRSTNAIPMTKDAVYTENTFMATSAGDPTYSLCNTTAGKGVWYSFTPANDAVVTINTCGSDFDTYLAIFTNNCLGCYSITDGCNNDNGPACPGNRASVAFFGKAGVNYLIFAAGNNGAVGNLSIQATVQPPLPNDQCSDAIALTNGVSFTMNTAAATSIIDTNANCQYFNQKGVWFSFTPLITNYIIISTDGSDYTPNISVYGGDCGQLTNVACGSSGAFFLGNAGQTYLIEAGGWPQGEMTGNLKITATGEPPFNDQSSGATSMAPGITFATNTTYATSTNDPIPLCDSTASHGVWYYFIPPAAAQITVETCDSDFETVLQVYRLDYPVLTPIACNDGFGPACATNRASVSFFGNTETNYLILAAGKNGAFGNLKISANGPPPANDTCDSAIDMTEGVVYVTNTTYASSIGDAFPVTKGIWYKFTPTRPGLLQISTCGSDFKTAFNVYTGACNALTYYNGAVADGFGICLTNASAQFPITPGTTYYIDAGGYIGTSGNLSIVATMPPPANDTCANASPLTNGVFYRMNTANATETGDPTPVCQTNFGKGVWFTFTPPTNGTVSISTCGGDLDSVLQIYTGSCGALVPLAGSCNDDAGPDCDGFTASLHFHGEAGVTYWILAGGYGGAGGNLGISAYLLPVINMNRVGTNWVLSWPSSLIGYSPQFATNLTPPIFWNSVTGALGFQDGNYFLTNSIPGKSIFYRLKR